MATVKFYDSKVAKAYAELKQEPGERKLLRALDRAFAALEADPTAGIPLRKPRIPRCYPTIDNVWKYDLPRGWRLLYSIAKGGIVVIAIVLEWCDHKEYERKYS